MPREPVSSTRRSVGASDAGVPPHKGESPEKVGGLRRETGASYKPTHAAFRGQSRWVGSCGRCGNHVESAAGQKKHPILGKLCTPCSGKVR